MTDWTDKFDFFHEWRTDVWLAEQSGIPRSTLGFVRRGERSLPAQYANAARSAYQRGMYDILGEEGFPRRARLQFSFAGRERYAEIRSELEDIVAAVAKNWTTQAALKAETTGKYFNWEEYYEDALEKARDTVYYSEMPWDDLKEGRISP